MGCGTSQPEDAKKPSKDDRKAATDENKEYQAKMQFLEKVPLMKRLPKDQHPLVASACETQEFKKGATVIKQGDVGEEFFVIRSGEASVMVTDESGGEAKKVARLKAGDYFGENALLRDEPRTATIVSESHLVTFKITRQKFQELGLNEKIQFANRKAVGAGMQARAVAHAADPKTPEDVKLIESALKNNSNLTSMVTLDDARVKALVEVAWKEEVKDGQELITEGDLNADYFYLVASGSFEIFVSGQDEANDPQSADAVVSGSQGTMVSTVGKGGSFGELALLYLVPRAATVKATSASIVWVIDRGNFKKVLMKVSDEKIKEYCKYLESVSCLSPLLRDEKREVAQALVEMHFASGDVVLQQGEPGNTFYILYEGTVKIVKDGKEVNQLTASAANGNVQFFGEKALLENEVRQATVQVASPAAKALVLDRDSFNMLLGPLKEILEKAQSQGGERRSMAKNTGAASMRPVTDGRPTGKILRKDLKRIGLLGCGGFGTVELYEHLTTGETFALKGLSKGYILKTGMQESVMNEKNILMMTNSSFIIKLHETYNGTQSLYFLLEPALGGELYATYNRKGFHGSTKHAKYYIAGVVLAFEHLHERRILYRDLKPENLLLTENGHIKLTDMGLAKFAIGKTFTTCGTPDYFAPELINSSGHNNALDWWTLGILIFELMSGHPPFESAYPMQIYSKVMKGIGKVTMPPKCQGPVGELIKALLKQEPSERLPMRSGGTKNIKDHKWFEKFDWEAMEKLTLEPPYKPVVKSKKDLANFSARKEDMPQQLNYVDPGTGWDKDFATC